MNKENYTNAVRATKGIDPEHDAESLHTAWAECQSDDLVKLIGRARNRAKDEYRRRRKQKSILRAYFSNNRVCSKKEDPTTDDLVRKEVQETVRSVLISLPSTYSEPAILHWLEGLSLDEIAKKLDRPVNTIYGQLHRAKEKLAQNQSLRRASMS